MNFNRKGNKLVTALLMALAVLLVFSACQPNKPADKEMTAEEKASAKEYIEAFFGSDLLADVNATFGEAAKDNANLDVTTNKYDETGKNVKLSVKLTDYELATDITVTGTVNLAFTSETKGDEKSFTATDYEVDGTRLEFTNKDGSLTLTLTDVKGKMTTGSFTVAEGEVTAIDAKAAFVAPVSGTVKANGKVAVTISDLIDVPLTGDNLTLVQGIYKTVSELVDDVDKDTTAKATYSAADKTVYDINYTYNPKLDENDKVASWTLVITADKQKAASTSAATAAETTTHEISFTIKSTDTSVKVTIAGVEYTATADDIKKGTSSHPGSNVPGYNDEKAFAEMFNTIDVNKFQNDFIKGITNSTAEDKVAGVTVPSLSYVQSGTEHKDVTKAQFVEFLTGLMSPGSSSNPGTLEAIIVPISFDNYKLGSEFEIVSGNATLTLAIGDVSEEAITGVYTLTADSADKLMVSGSADDKTGKALFIDNFSASFSIDLNALTEAISASKTKTEETTVENKNSVVLNLPYSGDAVSISYAGEALDWANLQGKITILEADEESSAVIDAELFYKHFGTKKFLKDLYTAIPANEEAENTVKLVVGETNIVSVENREEAGNAEVYTHSLTMPITFKGYNYYLSGSRQQVSGSVDIKFYGTIAGEIFTAKSFSVTSPKALDLVDSGTAETGKELIPAKRSAATVEFKEAKGKIGTQGIEFTITGSENNYTLSNITDYSESYNQSENEFIFDVKGITLKVVD